jgi:tRNA 2-thiouridine synthesizing protein C
MVKRILLVIKSPPYGGGRAAEGLRMATAMIAMDVLPEIVFIDDGVYCLLKNQKPETAGLKGFSDRLKTLSDLVGLNASSDALEQRHLAQTDIDDEYGFKALALREIADLFLQNEAVITF